MNLMPRVCPRPSLAASAAWLVLLLLAAVARANIGERWHGNYGSEPWGGLKSVVITREELVIDLRPLVTGEPAVVEATYHLNNQGPAKRLELLFIAGGSEINDFEVRLGDRLLPSKALSEDELMRRWDEIPKSWKAPIYGLPGIDMEGTYFTPVNAPLETWLLAFSVELPAANSTLRARYRARVPGTDEGASTATWQLPYVLGPAREWGGFGHLDVRAHLPAGWQHSSRPALEREGDVLHGSFEGIPADALVVATRAPVPPHLRTAVWLSVGFYGVALVGGGFLCHCGGRWLGRSAGGVWSGPGWSRVYVRWPVRVATVVLGLIWPALIVTAWVVAVSTVHGVLGEQEAPFVGEYFLFPLLASACFVLITLPSGFVLAWCGVRSGLARAWEHKVHEEHAGS
jgi:hypothetical protein